MASSCFEALEAQEKVLKVLELQDKEKAFHQYYTCKVYASPVARLSGPFEESLA